MQDDREKKFTENVITLTQTVSLVNNDYGDYFIASEQYSGAISRNILGVRVDGMQFAYGEGMQQPPTYAPTYASGVAGANTNLILSGFAAGDTLTIDPAKSQFIYPEITPTTPAGLYKMDFTGVSEANYPVLSNYIVWYQHGYLEATPRKIRISMLEGYEKKYGDTNPAFGVKYEYATGDTECSKLTKNSYPIYAQC